MNLTAVIDGKEIIPVRAIPFVTGWIMSPDVVAKSLANTDKWMTRLKDIASYHLMADGEYAVMLPKEWDCIEAELQVLSEKLQSNEEIDQENYSQWRRESIPLLPASCFVWKDEFIPSFSMAYSPQKLILINERPGDRELNFSPRVPYELLDVVMDGFIQKENSQNDDPNSEMIGRRAQQLEIILAVIAALGFEPMEIPDGGKAKIKNACLTRPRIFTSNGFDHAWKAGLEKNLFRLENADKYKS